MSLIFRCHQRETFDIFQFAFSWSTDRQTHSLPDFLHHQNFESHSVRDDGPGVGQALSNRATNTVTYEMYNPKQAAYFLMDCTFEYSLQRKFVIILILCLPPQHSIHKSLFYQNSFLSHTKNVEKKGTHFVVHFYLQFHGN